MGTVEAVQYSLAHVPLFHEQLAVELGVYLPVDLQPADFAVVTSENTTVVTAVEAVFAVFWHQRQPLLDDGDDDAESDGSGSLSDSRFGFMSSSTGNSSSSNNNNGSSPWIPARQAAAVAQTLLEVMVLLPERVLLCAAIDPFDYAWEQLELHLHLLPGSQVATGALASAHTYTAGGDAAEAVAAQEELSNQLLLLLAPTALWLLQGHGPTGQQGNSMRYSEAVLASYIEGYAAGTELEERMGWLLLRVLDTTTTSEHNWPVGCCHDVCACACARAYVCALVRGEAGK